VRFDRSLFVLRSGGLAALAFAAAVLLGAACGGFDKGTRDQAAKQQAPARPRSEDLSSNEQAAVKWTASNQVHGLQQRFACVRPGALTGAYEVVAEELEPLRAFGVIDDTVVVYGTRSVQMTSHLMTRFMKFGRLYRYGLRGDLQWAKETGAFSRGGYERWLGTPGLRRLSVRPLSVVSDAIAIAGVGTGQRTRIDGLTHSGAGFFVASYGLQGKVRWLNGSDGNRASPESVTVANDGSVVVAGWHWGDLRLGKDQDAVVLRDPSYPPKRGERGGMRVTDQRMFLARFDAQGHFSWAVQAEAESVPRQAAATDFTNDGGVVLTGVYGSSLRLGSTNGRSRHIVQPAAGRARNREPGGELGRDGSMFVARYDRVGRLRWARSGTSGSAGWAIATGPDGQTAVVGVFEDAVDFCGGAACASKPLRSQRGLEGFLALYGVRGSLRWAVRLDGSLHDAVDTPFAAPSDVLVDPDGRVFVAGCALGEAEFIGKGPMATRQLLAYVIAYSHAGDELWRSQMVGKGTVCYASLSVLRDGALAFAVEHNGEFRMAGRSASHDNLAVRHPFVVTYCRDTPG